MSERNILMICAAGIAVFFYLLVSVIAVSGGMDKTETDVRGRCTVTSEVETRPFTFREVVVDRVTICGSGR